MKASQRASTKRRKGFAPGALVLTGLIQFYRWFISPLLGPSCRHLPTCSAYGLEAVQQHGAWVGFWMTLARFCRCHPFGSHGYDPVPDQFGDVPFYAPWRYGLWSWSYEGKHSDGDECTHEGDPAHVEKRDI